MQETIVEQASKLVRQHNTAPENIMRETYGHEILNINRKQHRKTILRETLDENITPADVVNEDLSLMFQYDRLKKNREELLSDLRTQHDPRIKVNDVDPVFFENPWGLLSLGYNPQEKTKKHLLLVAKSQKERIRLHAFVENVNKNYFSFVITGSSHNAWYNFDDWRNEPILIARRFDAKMVEFEFLLELLQGGCCSLPTSYRGKKKATGIIKQIILCSSSSMAELWADQNTGLISEYL